LRNRVGKLQLSIGCL